jgi:hypothetical protein
MIYKLSIRYLDEKPGSSKTYVELFHAHGVQELTQELMGILLRKVEVLIIFATNRSQDFPSNVISSRVFRQLYLWKGWNPLWTDALPSLLISYRPSAKEDAGERVAQRHTFFPVTFMRTSDAMTVRQKWRAMCHNGRRG